MSYNFFDISNISSEEWSKLLKFALKISSAFKSCHIENPESFLTDSNINAYMHILKTTNMYYNNIIGDENIKNLFSHYLHTANMLYLEIPCINKNLHFINSLESLKDISLEYCINKPFGEEKQLTFAILKAKITKEILALIEKFDLLHILDSHIANSHLVLNLIEQRFNRSIFYLTRDYASTMISENEISILRNKNFKLGNITDYAINNYAYCELSHDARDLIYNLCNSFDKNNHRLHDIQLYDNSKRQILYSEFSYIQLCLSDSELDTLIESYNVDCSLWEKIKSKKIYIYPNDYFK